MTSQPSLPLGFAPTRADDPDTSREAADSVHVRASQIAVAALLAHGPATDSELIALAAERGVLITDSGLRTRRSELVRLGLAEDSGERRTTPSGRRSVVWQLTEVKWA